MLTVTSQGRDGFLDLVRSASHLKAAKRAGTETPHLSGRNLALVFEKASTRTRCAFEVAAADQGARTTYLGPDGSHIGREESIADTARVLGGMFDGIEFRGFDQSTVEELALHAGVPVWNGLTDQWHPTQMLADVLTMLEAAELSTDDAGALSCAFVGDGRNNVARSLLVTGALIGMDIRIVAPPHLQPPKDVEQLADDLAADSGARLTVTDDLDEGVHGARFVYTDVWVSMGEPDDVWDSRVEALRPYRVTREVMAATGVDRPRFLHCLPALHNTATEAGARVHSRYGLVGAEVSDDVFESEASIVFQQSANRMHTIKALLVAGYDQ
jgi:ornithine carbamoyltransferase